MPGSAEESRNDAGATFSGSGRIPSTTLGSVAPAVGREPLAPHASLRSALGFHGRGGRASHWLPFQVMTVTSANRSREKKNLPLVLATPPTCSARAPGPYLAPLSPDPPLPEPYSRRRSRSSTPSPASFPAYACDPFYNNRTYLIGLL